MDPVSPGDSEKTNCSSSAGDIGNILDINFWDDMGEVDMKVDAAQLLDDLVNGAVEGAKALRAGLASLISDIIDSIPTDFDFVGEPDCDKATQVTESARTDVATSHAVGEANANAVETANSLPASTVRDISADPVAQKELEAKMTAKVKEDVKMRLAKTLSIASSEVNLQNTINSLA